MKLKNCNSGLGRKTLVLIIVVLIGLCDPNISTTDAGHFGFKGGFRGGFGHKFKRGFSRKSFGGFGKFHSFGFRGFNSFGRSKFNSLAFRGRRFGFNRFNSFNRFGNFNRFASFNRFNSFNKFGNFGRFGSFNRFSSFGGFKSPGFNSFAFSSFPSNRFHSGFATFQPTFQPTTFIAAKPSVIVSPCGSTFTVAKPAIPVSPYIASRPVFTPTIASTQGWDLLADSKIADASSAFSGSIFSNNKPGESRVGYALASAASGDLDLGVKAMKRAFALNPKEVGSLMFDDKLLPVVRNLTRDYEARMDAGGSKNNDAFMLAALYQMQGDPEMASMAMDYLKDANSEAGTANLASVIKTEMESIPMTHGAGWDLLAAGRSQEAITSFVQNIKADSGSGVAKLGYGLAHAETGDFQHAAWAIRRAFEIDPQGVSDIMLDGKLRPTLQKIAGKFEASETMPLNQDNSLVLGTLYQLMGDNKVAEFVVEEGKLDPSSYLVSMIKKENKMEKEMMEESLPKLKDMDKAYPVYGPELPPSDDGPALPIFGPELPADDSEPVVIEVIDDIEKVLPRGSSKKEAPLLLEIQ